MTFRDVFYQVMREHGLSDERIAKDLRLTGIMCPIPVDQEIKPGFEEQAVEMLRGLYAEALANPGMAEEYVKTLSRNAARNN